MKHFAEIFLPFGAATLIACSPPSGKNEGPDSSEGGGTASSSSGGASQEGASSGAGGDASSGGRQGSGGRNGTSAGACHDGMCDGTCEGSNCDSTWTCSRGIGSCTKDNVPFCGCDGMTFHSSSTCPHRAYAHRGACEPTTEATNCDRGTLTCRALEQPCQEELTYREIVDGCWGDCVPITTCACKEKQECPEPQGSGDKICNSELGRCAESRR